MSTETPDGPDARPAPTVGTIKLMSFGFKFGTPNANYYFDVSFTSNPARNETWGLFSTVNPGMVDFVLGQQKVAQFIDLVVPLIRHIARVDSYQVMAFGCNAGRHRSPIIVDEIAARLMPEIPVRVAHRDLNEYEASMYELMHGGPHRSPSAGR